MAQQPDPRTHWNERFAAPGYRFGTAPNRFLESQKHRLRAGQRALAVADGEGRNGVWLARQGLAVTSVDISPVGQEKARALAKEAGVALDVFEADLAAWAWPAAAYDVVAAIFIQFAPPDLRARIFRSIEAALRPGGGGCVSKKPAAVMCSVTAPTTCPPRRIGKAAMARVPTRSPRSRHGRVASVA